MSQFSQPLAMMTGPFGSWNSSWMWISWERSFFWCSPSLPSSWTIALLDPKLLAASKGTTYSAGLRTANNVIEWHLRTANWLHIYGEWYLSACANKLSFLSFYENWHFPRKTRVCFTNELFTGLCISSSCCHDEGNIFANVLKVARARRYLNNTSSFSVTRINSAFQRDDHSRKILTMLVSLRWRGRSQNGDLRKGGKLWEKTLKFSMRQQSVYCSEFVRM